MKNINHKSTNKLLHKLNNNLLSNGSYVLFFLSLFIICTIVFDLDFKIGIPQYAKEMNQILLNSSYSILAACIFDFVVIKIPHEKKRRKMQLIIRQDIIKLKEQIRITKDSVICLHIDNNYNKDEYVKIFTKKDLYNKCLFNEKMTILDFLIQRQSIIRDSIVKIIFLEDFLSINQIGILNKMYNCIFLCNYIQARNFDLENNYNIIPQDNQEEMGRSLFDLYELSKELK